jgi:putative CocE/NonD family hydrolase
MIATLRERMLVLAFALGGASLAVVPAARTQNPPRRPAPAPAPAPGLPSETPPRFTPTDDGFDFERRDVMIPMRDGVRLHTVILVPRGAANAPILLTRTPYSATALTSHAQSAHLGLVLNGYDNATDIMVEGGYIRVVQDVRGKYGSEGDYVMNRPLRGPWNPTSVDHATDTYDTVEWLVHHVPESNGRVGILGISYDGFLPLMALVDPHPALKVAVAMNPMVDGWMGDDWFHNGAFRQENLAYIYEQEATRANDVAWYSTSFDDYDMFLRAGSAGELGRRRGMEQLGFWRKILDHPAYDAFWREQAVDRVLGARPLSIPLMLVHGLWDQEDIYGAIAVYKALEPRDSANDRVFLVIGPWHHGQQIGNASSLGPLEFGSNTGLTFRRDVLRPFLDRYLRDGAPRADVAPVTAFATGTNVWEHLSAWPAGCAGRCTIEPTPLYLRSGMRASFDAPVAGDTAFAEYVSDPAKPVPYRARPIRPVGYTEELTWWRWLVDDQREASGRTDVLAFVSDVLAAPVKIAGQPAVHLVASTSGTDADWVVKLIDVFPDETPGQLASAVLGGQSGPPGGYQLMVSADIFRGRYRESFETPRPITSDLPLPYRWTLPTANHVFLPGHRIMVQVQSSWFPLYDRNPQTFVPSIFWARPADYRRAVQRVYHAAGQASLVELPVVRDP